MQTEFEAVRMVTAMIMQPAGGRENKKAVPPRIRYSSRYSVIHAATIDLPVLRPQFTFMSSQTISAGYLIFDPLTDVLIVASNGLVVTHTAFVANPVVRGVINNASK
jgi:hypothetical protein